MSETKPQKRLVSKGRYVLVLGKRGGVYCLISVTTGIGLIGVLLTAVSWFQVYIRGNPAINPSCFSTCFAITFALWWIVKSLFVKSKNIEAVQLITAHKAHLLPAQETLLRGSDLPPSVQQAELLRATQAGRETPQEELLRATTAEE